MDGDAGPWGRALPARLPSEALGLLPSWLSEQALVSAVPPRRPRAEELPEVQALLGDGWEPLEDAPLFANLPAVWPLAHRCRVPPGRLWLLRSPWPTIGPQVVLQLMGRRARELGVDVDAERFTAAAPGLLALPEHEVWPGGRLIRTTRRASGSPGGGWGAPPPGWSRPGCHPRTSTCSPRRSRTAPTCLWTRRWTGATRLAAGGRTPSRGSSPGAGAGSPRTRLAWRRPNAARVWRSVGLTQADVVGGPPSGGGPFLPPDVSVGWIGSISDRSTFHFGVTDPPGTRGRLATDPPHRRPPR